MKKGRINLDIYLRWIDVYITENSADVAKINKIFKSDLDKDTQGYAFVSEDGLKYAVIYNKNAHSFNPGVVVHESMHLTQYVINSIGSKISDNNAEEVAYLLEYIFMKSMEIIDRK